jgi:hypothetical protein
MTEEKVVKTLEEWVKSLTTAASGYLLVENLSNVLEFDLL